MLELIILLSLILSLAGFGYLKYRRDKKAGVTEERLRNAERGIEYLEDENNRLANRPRSVDDIVDSLREWQKRTPSN